MTDFTERAARMRVLWNRGRHIYSTFYAELNDQRREQGDENLADWCFHELRISLSICNAVAGVLKKADATVVQRDLAEAVRIEKSAAAQQRAEQAERNRQEREAAHARRQAAAAEAAEAHARRQASAADAAIAKKAATLDDLRAQKKATRAAKGEMLRSRPPANETLRELLAQYRTAAEAGRIGLGRYYAAMKEIVQKGEAGLDEHSHRWTWGRWVKAYIPERTRRDVDRCIAEYVGHKCPTPQSENVFQFPTNVASAQ